VDTKQQRSVRLWMMGLLATSLFLAACGVPGPAQEQGGTIATERVQVASGSHIAFEGRSSLPGGTCLLTELAADGAAVSWWPAGQCVEVEDGRWEVSVPLGERGAPEALSEEKQYVLRVWARDDPSVQATPFWFDLSGPP